MLCDSWHFDDLIDNKYLEQSAIHPLYTSTIQMMIPLGYEHFIFTHQAVHPHVQIKEFATSQSRSGGMMVWGEKVAYFAYE
jgi:hypothetical protein